VLLAFLSTRWALSSPHSRIGGDCPHPPGRWDNRRNVATRVHSRRPGSRGVRRPPGPRVNLLRALQTIRHDPLNFHLDVARRFGDLAYYRAGLFHIYVVSHPDLIREVLVTKSHGFMKGQALQEAKRILGEGLLTSEGELHRRQRHLIQPVFHRQRVVGYGDVMASLAERHAGRWHDGQEFDLHRQMTRLTLAIVGATLFDTDVEDGDAAEVGRALTTAFDMFDRFFLPFSGLIERLPLPSNRRFEEARASLDRIVYGMIRDRRAGGDRGDLLSMLLFAGDGSSMEDRQVRDEAMTLFLAGHETTSNALTWTLYLLSRHPEVEARLLEELDRAIRSDRLPGAGDLASLPYLHRVLTESLRLYPPAWILGRLALEDVELGGYVIPKGATVVASPYLVHHDPRWYPGPERFDPDRWIDDGPGPGRPKYAYFPFGGGSRMCIGQDFAWMEAMLVLATVARRWRFRPVPGHPVQMHPMVTLRPRHGVHMRVERDAEPPRQREEPGPHPRTRAPRWSVS
jgi:cytochrome P450